MRNNFFYSFPLWNVCCWCGEEKIFVADTLGGTKQEKIFRHRKKNVHHRHNFWMSLYFTISRQTPRLMMMLYLLCAHIYFVFLFWLSMNAFWFRQLEVIIARKKKNYLLWLFIEICTWKLQEFRSIFKLDRRCKMEPVTLLDYFKVSWCWNYERIWWIQS